MQRGQAIPHEHVQWVFIYPQPDGSAIVYDTQTGVTARALTDVQVHEFAAQAARNAGYWGLGDAVARAASALGISKCAPCAKRQARLNAMFRRR